MTEQQKVYLTTREVADHLRYKDMRPVRKMIKAGKFGRPKRIGRRWLIKAINVPDWGTNGNQ